MTLNLLTTIFAFGLLSLATATDFPLTWVQSPVAGFADFTAFPGDTISLASNDDHDVNLFDFSVAGAQAAFDSCDFSNAALFTTLFTPGAFNAAGDVYQITITPNVGDFLTISPGDTFGIACSQGSGGHCTAGKMHFEVTIDPTTASPTESPTTDSPTAQPTAKPTAEPTRNPTESPLVQIQTTIFWGLPGVDAALPRFNQRAKITEEEVVNFELVAAHNFLEFLDEAHFNDCNFENATELLGEGVISDIVTVGPFPPGETHFYGCDKVTPQGQLHCKDLGQKMALTTVDRGDTLDIQWFRPTRQAEVDAFAAGEEILENEVLQFFFQQGASSGESHNLLQFLDEAAFDACDFNRAFDISGSSSLEEAVLYHDFFAVADVDTLYFGSSDINADSKTDCEFGQKIAVKVVSVKGQGDNNDDKPDNLAIIVGGAVAGVAIVAIAAVFIVRSGAGGPRNRGPSLNKLGMEPGNSWQNQNQMQSNKIAREIEVERAPYKSQMSSPKGTTSLARSKAQLSGLDF